MKSQIQVQIKCGQSMPSMDKENLTQSQPRMILKISNEISLVIFNSSALFKFKQFFFFFAILHFHLRLSFSFYSFSLSPWPIAFSLCYSSLSLSDPLPHFFFNKSTFLSFFISLSLFPFSFSSILFLPHSLNLSFILFLSHTLSISLFSLSLSFLNTPIT